MPLYYDVNYQRVGVTSTTYPELSGLVNIDLYEDLRNLFLAREIFPLDDYRNPSELVPSYGLFFVVNPLLKVLSGLNDANFYSTPETRYKVGTYSYIKGYEVVEIPDEPPVVYPYCDKPDYLVYERTAMDSGYLVIDPTVASSQALKVDVTGGGAGYVPCNPIIVNPYYAGSFVRRYCGGISLNLSPSVIADLVISYQYSVVSFYLDPTYPDYLYTY